MHLSDDRLALSTSVHHSICSDHVCIIYYLNFTVPSPRTTFNMTRNVRAIDGTTPKADLATRLSHLPCSSADDLDSVLTGILDDHASVKPRRVCPQKNSPWFSDIAVSGLLSSKDAVQRDGS